MNERSRVAPKFPEARNNNLTSKSQKTITPQPQTLNSPIVNIMSLQRTIGNQAVQRLFATGAIQKKLRIGQPNDIYEQEADRVADEVMRMVEPTIQPKPI